MRLCQAGLRLLNCERASFRTVQLPSLRAACGARHPAQGVMAVASSGQQQQCSYRPPPCSSTTAVAVQIPPPPDFFGLGARVEHVLANREDRVSIIVAEALQLPLSYVEALVAFGAIHTCPVPPTPPAELETTLPVEQVEEMRRIREAATQGHNPRLRPPRAQRVCEDVIVTLHSYIRVHVHPKRFPAAYSVRWEDRVVANAEEYVVLNKPAGVPVAPTVDNVLECAPTLAARAVGHPSPLLITHRLDQCTEGVLVLGKTAAFVGRFNALIRQGDGAVRKFYRALTEAPPREGTLLHHLSVAKRQVGLPVHTIVQDGPTEDSAPCELRVLHVGQVQLTGQAAQRWGPTAHECLIELITGRTHQIRAQLSAVGCPLLGDELYIPLASAELRQRLCSSDPCLTAIDDQGRRLLNEPAGPIGLQACRLVVEDGACMGLEGGPVEFEAGAPWWRASQ